MGADADVKEPRSDLVPGPDRERRYVVRATANSVVGMVPGLGLERSMEDPWTDPKVLRVLSDVPTVFLGFREHVTGRDEFQQRISCTESWAVPRRSACMCSRPSLSPNSSTRNQSTRRWQRRYHAAGERGEPQQHGDFDEFDFWTPEFRGEVRGVTQVGPKPHCRPSCSTRYSQGAGTSSR